MKFKFNILLKIVFLKDFSASIYLFLIIFNKQYTFGVVYKAILIPLLWTMLV